MTIPAQEGEMPAAFMWQHDETGRVGFVDPWQVENGWQANNPRCKIVSPLYRRSSPPVPAGVVQALENFDHQLRLWSKAYPEDVFPPPDFSAVQETLAAANLSLSCVSAANMRHVVTKLDEMFNEVRAALASIAPVTTKEAAP